MIDLPEITISPFKGFYDAVIIISFDVETSSIENNSIKNIFIRRLNKILNKYRNYKKALGYGIENREGIEKIIKIFRQFNIHGTWFGTGHCLIKDNFKKNRYRINQKLVNAPYLHKYRIGKKTFGDEPYSSYIQRPDYYLGDIFEKLYLEGEDIQCHTFSHTYLSLESNENIAIDLEDWQKAAIEHGFKQAKILAFPYLGDAHLYYPELNVEQPFPNYINGKKFIIKEISLDRLHLLEKNGIELLTRSSAKMNNNNYNFFRYNDLTNLYCVQCEPIKLLPFDLNHWEKMIEKILNLKGIIDLWCHPYNINDETEGNFEKLITLLVHYYENSKINLSTFIDAWEHFKNIKNIELKCTQIVDNIFEIIITNNNITSIDNVCINFNSKRYSIIKTEDNLDNIIISDGKFIFKKMNSKQLYRVKFKIK